MLILFFVSILTSLIFFFFSFSLCKCTKENVTNDWVFLCSSFVYECGRVYINIFRKENSSTATGATQVCVCTHFYSSFHSFSFYLSLSVFTNFSRIDRIFSLIFFGQFVFSFSISSETKSLNERRSSSSVRTEEVKTKRKTIRFEIRQTWPFFFRFSFHFHFFFLLFSFYLT